MSQLGLDWPEASLDDTALPAARHRPPVTEALKRDIISVLHIDQLPSHLGDHKGEIRFSLWPEARDFQFLEAVLNDMQQPGGVNFHTLKRAVRDLIDEDRVVEDRWFYGSDQPGEYGYRGWKPVFRVAGAETA